MGRTNPHRTRFYNLPCQFASKHRVFHIRSRGEVPELDPRHRGVIQADCEFTVDDVVEQLRKLKADKSPGMDGSTPKC